MLSYCNKTHTYTQKKKNHESFKRKIEKKEKQLKKKSEDPVGNTKIGY